MGGRTEWMGLDSGTIGLPLFVCKGECVRPMLSVSKTVSFACFIMSHKHYCIHQQHSARRNIAGSLTDTHTYYNNDDNINDSSIIRSG